MYVVRIDGFEASKELQKVMMATSDLPVIPVVATRVMQLMRDDGTDASEIAEVIASDPAVAARVLKISNSSYYGAQGKIQSLPHAIMVLGFVTLKSIVVAAAVKQVYQPFGEVEKMLWEHSVGAGVASRLIAKELPGVDPDEAFVCGLFHDIGKQVMNFVDKQKFMTMLESIGSDRMSGLEEKSAFQFTHEEAGAMIIKKWELPDHLSQAVFMHHAPEGDVFANIANLANLFCHRLGIGTARADEELDVAGCQSAQSFGFDEHKIDTLLERFAEATAHDQAFFS